MARSTDSAVFPAIQIIRNHHRAAILEEKLYLEWYNGPRREGFSKHFHRDTVNVRSSARKNDSAPYEVGEFDFSHQGAGTQADALLVLAENVFLICNNTRASMNEIEKNHCWLKAQNSFAGLSEKILVSPLEIASTPGGPQL
jgi:hypothetical protein